MLVFLLRISGGVLGGLVVHAYFQRTLFGAGHGEGCVALGLWFFCGGWMIVLFWYLAGVLIGALSIVPLINTCGTIALRIWDLCIRRV
jgi:hypothetical protein